jgi:SAM-dependent methyltransferase
VKPAKRASPQWYELPGLALRTYLFPVVRRIGPLRAASEVVRMALLRLALFPGQLARSRNRPKQPVRPSEDPELLAQTEALNQAAETYFAEFPDPAFLIAKPFSEPVHFAKQLFSLSVLVHRLRLRPGDLVVELGAGSCWLSHFLNRFGCPTVSVDVSATALELGRRLFEADPATRWELKPRFLSYDGHSIPLPDACCDQIVIFDAFHHIPNQREILDEMARILKPGGAAAMCEPGFRHAETPQSRREAATGVLENNIVVEEVAALAEQCGFARATLALVSLQAATEIPVGEFADFLNGKGILSYWPKLCDGLEDNHYLFLYKSESDATTARPRILRAALRARRRAGGTARRLRLRAGERGELSVRIDNRGDTLWLAGEEHQPGWTRLGIHLFRASDGDHPLEFDWVRQALPHDVAPLGRAELRVSLPPLAGPGDYRLVLDLVIEGLTWFEEQGSQVLELPLTIVD